MEPSGESRLARGVELRGGPEGGADGALRAFGDRSGKNGRKVVD
jgi:hypothetical protein